ncbi:AraC family transcriptional regulator [Allorhizobium borbori]|uniref:AraC-like DNA-binding protein n=1 Tax=Allorhizobium borbori TaxID=485907 RepID=A0A7W6K109_9HYPH|nr:AraC family transcriptional regulator [Allorhizobium borbori]MBB4103122.1 AraC-like DNA-binding protein [Allorhizobium borbori]
MFGNSSQGFEKSEPLSPELTFGIERLCKGEFQNGLRVTSDGGGIERIEARFRGNGFSPHRHDTYALGLTLHGVQTFRYRGADRFSSPGKVIVLHPDEVHDGAAGTADGLIYRMVYLPPELIGSVHAHTRSLPFVPDPVVTNEDLWHALATILYDLDHGPDELALDDAIARISVILSIEAGAPAKPVTKIARIAILRARDYLTSHSDETIRSETLEALTGLDRYSLARQFRLLLGTSPHRYVMMRRLDRAKLLMEAGVGLARVAAECQFSDQAHLTRQFRSAFGMTPGRWLAMRADRHIRLSNPA